MSDFSYIGGNEWKGGRLYDPEKGKTYSGKITLVSPNELDLAGLYRHFPDRKNLEVDQVAPEFDRVPRLARSKGVSAQAECSGGTLDHD